MDSTSDIVKLSKAEWAHIRQDFVGRASARGAHLVLRDRVWAVTRTGSWIALPGTSDSPVADRWWLGCDSEKMRDRQPLGVILLCKSQQGPLHAIGLPGELLRSVEPKLFRNARQLFFNVSRRGERFFLQLRGGEELDVSQHVDDVSWISTDKGAGLARHYSGPSTQAVVRETPEPRSPSEEPAATSTRFFAVVKNGALHPLDDVTLQSGSLYLVDIREAPSVPGNRSLRRILARGGLADLPSDFAQQHDHYAHGAERR
jgi:hypothetical protein